MSLIFSLFSHNVCFLVIPAVWKAMLVWPSPKFLLSSSNIPKVQKVRTAKWLLWNGCSSSILSGSTYANFSQPGFTLAILKCLVNCCKTTLWKQMVMSDFLAFFVMKQQWSLLKVFMGKHFSVTFWDNAYIFKNGPICTCPLGTPLGYPRW